jgi:alpha-galactosidase
MSILDKQPAIAKYNGSNHWNDPDMLEVGNGMSFNEDKAHFSLWCMLAAPLAAGNDLRKMSPQTQSILTNKEAIAIDQDVHWVFNFTEGEYKVRDLWAKKNLGTTKKQFKQVIAPHDVVMLRLHKAN